VKSASLIPGQKSRDESEAAAFLRELEDMIDDGRYQWAEDTLEGIRETVERTRTVTDNQKRAVENITNARGGRLW
jgi:hypothetical protein